MTNWDNEYKRRGIPSSFRDEPSGVLTWTLANWPFLTGTTLPEQAIDVGCGTGRNPLYMAGLGINVLAFDSSATAIATARNRLRDISLKTPPQFLQHDLALGIPADDAQVDLVTDIFVYKHQLLPSVRATYRKELQRVLRPKGRLLISLAEREDGYYSQCPDLQVAERGNPRTIIDPAADIGSVLFSLEELQSELSDVFALEIAWHKSKSGMMHGERYLRHTLATIWRLKE